MTHVLSRRTLAASIVLDMHFYSQIVQVPGAAQSLSSLQKLLWTSQEISWPPWATARQRHSAMNLMKRGYY